MKNYSKNHAYVIYKDQVCFKFIGISAQICGFAIRITTTQYIRKPHLPLLNSERSLAIYTYCNKFTIIDSYLQNLGIQLMR